MTEKTKSPVTTQGRYLEFTTCLQMAGACSSFLSPSPQPTSTFLPHVFLLLGPPNLTFLPSLSLSRGAVLGRSAPKDLHIFLVHRNQSTNTDLPVNRLRSGLSYSLRPGNYCLSKSFKKKSNFQSTFHSLYLD